MTALKELHEVEDLQEVWDASKEKPVLLFKQNTSCPISAEAFRQYNEFLEKEDANIEAYFVKVRETRPVSNQIAEDMEVEHESPQLFLVKDGKPAWHTSMHNITYESIQDALAEN